MPKPTIYTVAIVTFLLIIVASAGYLFYKQKKATTFLTYSNQTYGLTFIYPKKYAITETKGVDPQTEVISLHEKGIHLFSQATSSDAITISVYEGASTTTTSTSSLAQWIRTSPFSQFTHSTMKEPGATRVGNQDALLYTWKDTSEGTTVITSYQGRILVFTVIYEGNGDMERRADFTDLMASVIFGEVQGIPTN